MSATVSHRDLVVSALLVANAFGEPGAVSRDVLEGQDGDATVDTAFENTTIGVIATNGALDKVACLQVAQAAHDGLARAVVPAHTAADGDAFVVAATGEVDADVAVARTMAVVAVEDAFAMLDPARDRGPRK